MIRKSKLLVHRPILIIFFGLFIILSAYRYSHSELIQLKSGKQIEGKIVEKTEDLIRIDTGVGVITTHYIDEISTDGEKSKGFISNEKSIVQEDSALRNHPMFRNKNQYSFNAKFTPPDNTTLLVIGQDKQSIKNYTNKVNANPGGLTVYTSIQKMNGLYKPFNNGGGTQHGQYLIDNYPNSAIHVGLYMVGGLDGVIGGKYDNNIKKLGNWFLENADRPFYLRIGYEFDSPYNNYNPVKYVNVYQYIVLRLHMMGVENVSYVWHSYAAKSKHAVVSWYPGDEYVDWVAISYFNPYNTEGMENIANIARRFNKPLMIAEATPVKHSTSKGQDTWKRWFDFVFKFIEKYDVKIFCYINCDWDKLPSFAKDRWGDARIEANSYIKKKWIETVDNEKYLKASPSLFKQLRFN